MNVGMMDNAASLVAFTRLTKGQYRLYGSYDDVGELHTRLGLERLKDTVLDAGLRAAPTAQASLPPVAEKGAHHPEAQRSTIQSRLDALLHDHKEKRGAWRPMSESESKARRLLEVFEQGHLRVARPPAPSVVAEKPELQSRHGLVR